MLAKTLILILTSKIILAQINGEFWWLSDKLPNVKYVEAPKIEDDNVFETGESAKIIFRDKDDNVGKLNAITVGDKQRHKSEKWKIDAHYSEDNRIIYPGEYITQESKTTTTATTKLDTKEIEIRLNISKPHNEDVFKFNFPDDYLLSKDTNNINKITTSKKKIHHGAKDKMEFETNKFVTTSESICSYMKKNDCYRLNGLIYNRIDTPKSDTHQICCILPLAEEELLPKIVFPGPSTKRKKRSKPKDDTNLGLVQRDVLLKRRYVTSVDDKKDITSKIVSPDVSEEDYNTDPYWNVKSPKLKSSSNSGTKTKNDCYQDEDYAVELPKPGLLGVYSDHNRPGWPVSDNQGYGDDSYDDVYDDDPPGYSTIDPRRDTTTSKFPKRGRPSKLSTVFEDYDPESQTISYQSSPDFQVLQGFKLINLARNKNKYYSNSKKITTTENVFESEESIFSGTSSENLNKDFVASTRQVYRHCGKVAGNFASKNVILVKLHLPPQDDIAELQSRCDHGGCNSIETSTEIKLKKGKQLGGSENGLHPWLALVVLSKRRQVILCYATIVHPRAALTAADCTYGRSSGDFTLMAGVRDLKDRSHAQYRAVAILPHPQYKPNDLTHNLAILHWNYPLKLTANVQPACLGEPQSTGDCFVYGWGGYDQAIRSLSRWQRATVLSPRQCTARFTNQAKGSQLPNGAFCAEVQARGTVTGIGGPLICAVDGRHTATGVAVWRNTALMLLPTTGWPVQALETLLGT